MNLERLTTILSVLAVALLTVPAFASSPTYGASAASMVVDPITENYTCGTVNIGGVNVTSRVPDDRCYSGDMTASGFRKQGNGTTYGDSHRVAQSWAGIGIPAPENDSPTNGDYILWAGGVGGWGSLAGPGSHLTGDNFVIWYTPNTHDGRRAQNGTLTLLNDSVRPQDGGFWIAGGFIHDTDFGKWVIPTVVTYPTGNQNTFTDVVFKVGTSANGYSNYTWRDVVHFKFNPPTRSGDDYGTRWHYQSNQFVKDPANSDRWIGMVPFTNLDTTPVRGSAPAMIDFSEASNPAVGIQLCLGFEPLAADPNVRQGFSSQYDFYCYKEAESSIVQVERPTAAGGGEALPYQGAGEFVRSVAKVTTSHGTQGEIWLSIYNDPTQWCSVAANRNLLGYTSESQCALERNFCGGFLDSSLYLTNRSNLLGGTTEKPRYFEWDMTTLLKVGSAKFLDNDLSGLNNSTRGWPSPAGDHGNTYVGVTRYDWGEKLADGSHKEALYVGVKRSICLEDYQNEANERFLGNGTAFLNLLEK